LNNEEGLYVYGYFLYHGIEIPQNKIEGLKLIEKAAQMGHTRAKIDFGELSKNPIDPFEEAKIYRNNSIRKNEMAMIHYSIILCFGYGTTQNLIDAIYWSKRSKMQSNIHFASKIAFDSKVKRFYTKSQLNLREKKLAVAMAEGIAFEFGMERKQSYPQAFLKYKIGAEGGISSAMVVVGKMYKSGIGVEYDLRESRKWFLRAADLGNFHGIREIGLGYEFCEEFEGHKEKAMEWYWLGLENGDYESSRLWLRLWLNSCAHWFYRKGTRTCKLNREFYDRNLLLKYFYDQYRHYENDFSNFPEKISLPWELTFSGDYFHELSDEELLDYLSE
jgi:TPR repeat protein